MTFIKVKQLLSVQQQKWNKVGLRHKAVLPFQLPFNVLLYLSAPFLDAHCS